MNSRQAELDGCTRTSTPRRWVSIGFLVALSLVFGGCETTEDNTSRVYDGEEEVWVDENGRELDPSRTDKIQDDDGWRVRSNRRGQADTRSW